jgi:two-component system, NtrC family, response regulator AtoC
MQTNTTVKPHSILVVDDEKNIREVIRMVLQKKFAVVRTAASAEDALEMVRDYWYDVILTDVRMQGLDGLTFLKRVKEENSNAAVVIMTAHGNMDMVIQAMRLGAADFISKPFENQQLLQIMERLTSSEVVQSSPSMVCLETSDSMTGASEVFLQARSMALRAAVTDSTVLIQGESGTGKEVMARFIHDNSLRKNASFIAINCGAIPENLVESELFGYEKGAFTGAVKEKPGKFELADGGTLFLDEMGELPLHIQVKLLRVLQERRLQRVGAINEVTLDIRVIAATNRNLAIEVAQGKFREDLFYRLNIIPLQLPPLRERGRDIALLARFFLEAFNKRYQFQYQLQENDLIKLESYAWPGNIRQLENTMERAVVLGSEGKLFFDLPSSLQSQTVISEDKPEQVGLQQIRHEAEASVILEALEKSRWNRSRTAELLGISRRSLLYKMKAFGIQ